MPALNLQFTDAEMEALRDAAKCEGRSLEAFAHDLVVRSISSRKHLVRDAAARVGRISTNLNTRLTEK